jgi:protein CpxP
MKKLILVVTLVISTLTFAQERSRKGEKLTPEQQTELQVKKMTLELDLDAKQQKELKAILLEQAQKREGKIAEIKAKREKGEKLSADEKFELKNRMLDNQIENKSQMKKILKPEQFKKWEQNLENRKEKMSEKRENGRKKRKSSQQKQE